MLAYLFILAAIPVRFLPHPFSFTPVGAALLFFGAYGASKRAWIYPVALLVRHVYLTLFHYGYPFAWDTFVTWGWYAAIILLGAKLLRGGVRPVVLWEHRWRLQFRFLSSAILLLGSIRDVSAYLGRA